MTVYRRPDPIPLHRSRPAVTVDLGYVRPDQEDLHYLVARRIFLAIAAGVYPEGSILPTEQALSEQLGVSRTALREAIKGLASKGLLETRRRRGTLVLDRSRWNMLDADVIDWLRRDDSDAVSQELWSTIVSLLPQVVGMGGTASAATMLGSRVAKGEMTVEARAEFLAEIARSTGNRFASSVVMRCLQSLMTGDRHFLDRATRAVTPDAVRAMAGVVESDRGAARLLRMLQPAPDTVIS